MQQRFSLDRAHIITDPRDDTVGITKTLTISAKKTIRCLFEPALKTFLTENAMNEQNIY